MKKNFILLILLVVFTTTSYAQTLATYREEGFECGSGTYVNNSLTYGKYFKAGSYLTMGNTSSINGGNSPYISFNAVYASSANNSSSFVPAYNPGSGLVIFGEAGGSGLHFKQRNWGSSSVPKDIQTDFTEVMTLTSNGNLGIGVSSPGARLHVSGGLARIDNNLFLNNSAGNASVYSQNDITLQASTSNYVRFSAGGAERMKIEPSGRVTIGTNVTVVSSPAHDYRLVVDGAVGARELYVTLLQTWPDYVFGSNYNLRSLSSLEQYIKDNHHLPNIPSAADIKKDGSINVGEMNAKLLEKVEEITLYVIELQKQNDKMQKQIAELSALK